MKGNIYKVSGYFVDPDSTYTPEKFESRVNNITATVNQHLHVEAAEIDIEDDDPLLFENCDLAFCEEHFKANPTLDMGKREVKVGEKYRHFKEGKIVTVIAIAQDTECPGSYSVVYSCNPSDPTDIWSRPYDMFISLTDKEKYPDATQEYRFEKIEG